MVARYNPCGAPVEIGRAPYRTRVRLYPDTEEEFELEWYPARDDVPFLRGPHAVNSLYWCRDRDEYLQTSVGEIPGTARVYNPERGKPLAIGGHVCGTAEDFAGDGVYDPEPPFVEYRPDGLPTCCGALFEGIGGLVVGGTCDVVNPIVPGDDCLHPAHIEMGVEYAVSYPGGFVSQWFQIPVVAPPGTYHITLTGTAPTLRVELIRGLNCGFEIDGWFGTFASSCGTATFFVPGTRFIHVRVGQNVIDGPPAEYTFRVDPGACP